MHIGRDFFYQKRKFVCTTCARLQVCTTRARSRAGLSLCWRPCCCTSSWKLSITGRPGSFWPQPFAPLPKHALEPSQSGVANSASVLPISGATARELVRIRARHRWCHELSALLTRRTGMCTWYFFVSSSHGAVRGLEGASARQKGGENSPHFVGGAAAASSKTRVRARA